MQVFVVGAKSKGRQPLKNGVHALRGGRFIIIQNGKPVGADMIIDPADLPRAAQAGKKPEGRAEGILIGLNQPRVMGDGSVRLFDKAGTQQKTLGNGLHRTGEGKFIIIQNGKIVGPTMIVGPTQLEGLLLPAVQKVAPPLQPVPQMPGKR
jgi:hypothetical protein